MSRPAWVNELNESPANSERKSGVIEPLAGAWVVEEIRDRGNLTAIKICSALLEDHLWLILDRSFAAKDGLAIYYPEELPELRTKTLEQLREIHSAKLAFPGCRVIQEGAERREL